MGNAKDDHDDEKSRGSSPLLDADVERGFVVRKLNQHGTTVTVSLFEHESKLTLNPLEELPNSEIIILGSPPLPRFPALIWIYDKK